MIVSHSRRFIFVHLHKTAGESVSEALQPFLARGDVMLGTSRRGEIWNAWYQARHGVQKHSNARRIRSYVGAETWDRYLSFSFVRDPADRARSLYFYFERMLARRRQRSLRNAVLWVPGLEFRDPLKWPGMQAYLETSSFSEFIRHPRFGPSVIGARRQSDALCDENGRLLVDVVGRFETLQQDFAALAARLGLADARLGWRNASGNTAGRAAGPAPIDPADRAFLVDMYRRDYELFGYPTG
jgi:hypothetical protein